MVTKRPNYQELSQASQFIRDAIPITRTVYERGVLALFSMPNLDALRGAIPITGPSGDARGFSDLAKDILKNDNLAVLFKTLAEFSAAMRNHEFSMETAHAVHPAILKYKVSTRLAAFVVIQRICEIVANDPDPKYDDIREVARQVSQMPLYGPHGTAMNSLIQYVSRFESGTLTSWDPKKPSATDDLLKVLLELDQKSGGNFQAAATLEEKKAYQWNPLLGLAKQLDNLQALVKDAGQDQRDENLKYVPIDHANNLIPEIQALLDLIRTEVKVEKIAAFPTRSIEGTDLVLRGESMPTVHRVARYLETSDDPNAPILTINDYLEIGNFDGDSLEFKKSITSKRLLRAVIRGQKQYFPDLSEGNFHELRRQTLAMLGTGDDKTIDADKLDAYIFILGNPRADFEKTPAFRNISPQYRALTRSALSSSFNFVNFIKGETLPANLEAVRTMSDAEWEASLFISYFKFFVSGSVVPGIGAKVSMILRDDNWNLLRLAATVRDDLKSGSNLEAVYNQFVAAPLALDDPSKLQDLLKTRSHLEGNVLMRLTRNLELSKMDEALDDLIKAWDSLDKMSKSILIYEMTSSGLDGKRILLAHASDSLSSISHKTPEAIANVLRAHARVYQQTRTGALKNDDSPGVYTVDIKALGDYNREHGQFDPNLDRLNRYGFEATTAGSSGYKIVLSVHEPFDLSRLEKVKLGTGIRGQTIIPIGIGQGADGIPAATLAKLLEAEGRQIPAVISVRTQAHAGPAETGRVSNPYLIEDATELARGVYRLNHKDFKHPIPPVENILAKELPMFLVVDNGDPAQTQQRIQKVLDHVGGADNVVVVDTGGASLQNSDTPKATDLPILKTLHGLAATGQSVQTALIGPGIDTPPDAAAKLDAMFSKVVPLADHSDAIRGLYSKWEMAGHNPKKLVAILASLDGIEGYQALNMPIDSMVFVPIDPSMANIVIQDIDDHYKIVTLKASIDAMVQAAGQRVANLIFTAPLLDNFKRFLEDVSESTPTLTNKIQLGDRHGEARSLEEIDQEISRTNSTAKLLATIDDLWAKNDADDADFDAKFHDGETTRLSLFLLVRRIAELNVNNARLTPLQRDSFQTMLDMPASELVQRLFVKQKYARAGEDSFIPNHVFEALLNLKRSLQNDAKVGTDHFATKMFAENLRHIVLPAIYRPSATKIVRVLEKRSESRKAEAAPTTISLSDIRRQAQIEGDGQPAEDDVAVRFGTNEERAEARKMVEGLKAAVGSGKVGNASDPKKSEAGEDTKREDDKAEDRGSKDSHKGKGIPK